MNWRRALEFETNRSKCFKEYKCHKRKFQCLYCIIFIIGDEKHKEYIFSIPKLFNRITLMKW